MPLQTLFETPMPQADFVIAPSWVIPVIPSGVVLVDHAVAVHKGKICGVLPATSAREQWPDAPWQARPGCVLIPGLINAHTHAAMSLLRGYADDLPLSQWLTGHIWPAEQRFVNREFVRDGVDLAILEMIRGGTTCFQDMYMFPDEVGAVAAERGIRAVTSMIVIEMPTPWAETVDEYISRGLEVHDRYRDHPLVRTTFGPHAPYTVTDATLERLVTLANQLDVGIQMHVHETQQELSDSQQHHGKKPLSRLDQLGAVTPLLNAVHAIHLDADDRDLLAQRGASVIHCPESNMKLASGICPVSQLLDAGINVALGTDGPASNNDLDMFGEMRSAALLAKVTTNDAAALPAATALAMATINGARALGLEAQIGSLEPEKSADMVCVDLSAPSCQPVHSPLSQLVYSATRDQVTDVWVAGQLLYGANSYTTADAADIMARTQAWLERMQAQT